MKKLVFALSLIFVINGISKAQMVDDAISAQDEPNPVENWYHENLATDSIYGVAADQANEWAQKSGKKPSTIIVAVIDGGVDNVHEDLDDVMWINEDEIPNNGKDDDKNGYVDDIHGWNFIGGAEGNVDGDNLEITREVRKYLAIFDSEDTAKNEANQKKMPEEYAYYTKIKQEFENSLAEATMMNSMMGSQANQMKTMFESFGNAYGGMDKPVTVEGLEAMQSSDPLVNGIKMQLLSAKDQPEAAEFFGKTTAELLTEVTKQLEEGVKYYHDQVAYHYNVDFNPRNIVGDNYEDKKEKNYGNNNVKGPDSSHGTHVAGIIAAERNNNLGMNGIAANVKIMGVRAVPNGDEHDKDVANSIRYAVDNGAKIINMSFGKAYSPDKEVVWEAMKYATDKGVLLVHAAGNDNKDIDSTSNFPTNYKAGKEFSNTWLTVGASTRYNDNIKASFSNFGKQQVDIFAPGLEIYSTMPENTYDFQQGTSMAAPVVSGVAALVWSYFPNLSAKELKEILIESGNKHDGLEFISTDGVVVDAMKALKLAEQKSK